jgi:AcrR family transcriptional regulator
VRDSQERICEAMLDLASTQGYEATEIDAIVARAGASREEFDDLFASKEDCAIAVFDRFMEGFNRKVSEAYERETEWPDSLRAAAYTVAGWMTEHPREARFGAIELLWAGELTQTRREASFQRFVGMIDAGRARLEDPDSVTDATAEHVIGSLAEMITKRAQGGELDPYQFVPDLMYLAVLPYLGEEEAAKELSIPPPPRPSKSD